MEGLKKVPDCWRIDSAHDVHVQAAFLRATPESNRGKAFIVAQKLNCAESESRWGQQGKTPGPAITFSDPGYW